MAEKKSKNLLISFVGPSCAGKSTCYEYAHDFLNERDYIVWRRDVAYPLRLTQKYAYEQFGVGSPGDPERPETFHQDGQLLSFLAKHFGQRLGWRFEREIEVILKGDYVRPFAVINTDCHNNAYENLKRLGFVFVRIDASPDTLAKRRAKRGDLTPFDPKTAIEQISQIHPKHCILNNGTKEGLGKSVRETLKRIINDPRAQ